ncbi:MAG: S8 family serine peptidase, partial [Stellaceae bacterium]
PQEVNSLQPGWAVAVAITPGGTLASYSNACGATAAYCLAAVGGPVSVAVSTAVSSTGYVLSNAPNAYLGTSFATPAVTGAIALLMSAAPNITAQQALQILFMTANKSGAYAQAALYGQGVIDLNAAMQPVGEPVVSAQGVASAPLAATALTLGGAFGTGPMRALATTPLTVQDSFARGFVVPLGSRLGPAAPSFDAPERVALFGKADRVLFDDGASRFALVQSADPRIESPDRSGLRFVARERIGGAVTLRVAAGVDPARLLPSGSEGATAGLTRNLLAPGAAANPYLALIDKPLAAGAEVKLGAMRAAMVSAVGEPILPAGITEQPGAPPPRIFASDVEAEYRLGLAGLLRLDGGAMIESNTLLGTYGSGSARMNRSETWFAGIGGEWQLNQSTTLAAGFHAGLSAADGAPGSIVQSAANIGSFAAGLGVVGRDWLRQGDKVTLGVALPLRAVSGHSDLLVPTTVNLDGSVTPRAVEIGMNADGSELDLQGAWTVPVAERAELTSGLLLRKDADNIRGAPLEAVAAVRVDLRF